MTDRLSKSNRQELLLLLDDLCEQQLSVDQADRMMELLGQSEEAVRLYVRYLDLHGRAIWDLGGVTPQALAEVDRVVEYEKGGDKASAVIIEVQSDSLSRRKKRYDSIHWQRHKIRFNAMTAVLTALAWVGFSFFVWFTTTPDNSRPERTGNNIEYVAEITGQYEPQWAEGMQPLSSRAVLLSGQRLILDEGLIEITFDDGAVVVLEGPTEFVVDSAGAGTLESGRLSAIVPPEAIGFAISTPELRLVDLGTRFGVEVDGAHGTSVHVFGGVVEVYRGENDHHPVKLGQGDGLAVDRSGDVRSVAADAGQVFILNLPRSVLAPISIDFNYSRLHSGEPSNIDGSVLPGQVGDWLSFDSPLSNGTEALSIDTGRGIFTFNPDGVDNYVGSSGTGDPDPLRHDVLALWESSPTPIVWTIADLTPDASYDLILFGQSKDGAAWNPALFSIRGHDAGNGVGKPVTLDAEGDGNFTHVIAIGGTISGTFAWAGADVTQFSSWSGLQFRRVFKTNTEQDQQIPVPPEAEVGL